MEKKIFLKTISSHNHHQKQNPPLIITIPF